MRQKHETMTRNTLFLITILISIAGFSQDESSIFIDNSLKGQYDGYRKYHSENRFSDYKDNDFSSLWLMKDCRLTYGFIGSNYQRFQIKLISIIKDPSADQTYRVFGKSKVYQNVCDFQGFINIKSIYHVDNLEYPDTVCGVLVFDYTFYEDPKQKHVGTFKGKGVLYWYQDSKSKILYDDLMAIADGFRNNQFVGIWTEYLKSNPKTCNWGDYRIPMSGDLNSGAGEFVPNEKYRNYGWENYLDTYSFDDDKKREKAEKNELQEWWK
jgi:hypothetical protein